MDIQQEFRQLSIQNFERNDTNGIDGVKSL